jgi:hypothetical protein
VKEDIDQLHMKRPRLLEKVISRKMKLAVLLAIHQKERHKEDYQLLAQILGQT